MITTVEEQTGRKPSYLKREEQHGRGNGNGRGKCWDQDMTTKTDQDRASMTPGNVPHSCSRSMIACLSLCQFQCLLFLHQVSRLLILLSSSLLSLTSPPSTYSYSHLEKLQHKKKPPMQTEDLQCTFDSHDLFVFFLVSLHSPATLVSTSTCYHVLCVLSHCVGFFFC